MSFIKANYKQLEDEKKNYEAMQPGVYELKIKSVKTRNSKRGSKGLTLDLVVRDDLDDVDNLAMTNRKYHRRHIFDDIWAQRSTGDFNPKHLMMLMDAAGIPEGAELSTIDDFIDEMTGRCIRAEVSREIDEFHSERAGKAVYKNTIAPWDFSPSQFDENQREDIRQKEREANHEIADEADNLFGESEDESAAEQAQENGPSNASEDQQSFSEEQVRQIVAEALAAQKQANESSDSSNEKDDLEQYMA